MPTVAFTAHLRSHAPPGPLAAGGGTVREVLDDVLARHPALRGYLLDDQGRLRRHVAILVDGEMIRDRTGLGDPVGADAEVFVMQALSGG